MNIWEALYDALCRRSCRFLVCRMEVGERSTIGPELVRSTSEIVDLNREASSHGLEPIEEFVSKLSLDDPYLKCLITQQGQYALA